MGGRGDCVGGRGDCVGGTASRKVVQNSGEYLGVIKP